MVHSHTVLKRIFGPVIVLYYKSHSSNEILSISKESNSKGLKLTKTLFHVLLNMAILEHKSTSVQH